MPFTPAELEAMRLADEEIDRDIATAYVDRAMDKWLDELAIMDMLDHKSAHNRKRSKKYAAAYYAEHKDEIAAYQAAYYAEHKDEIAAYKAAYRAEHKDEIAAYQAAYYAEHKEARREQYNAYMREYQRKRRQQMREAVRGVATCVEGCP